MIDGWGISSEIALIWMSLDLTNDKSTLVQVMSWCHQATSHYLSQCWPRSMLPYGVTRPQWVNSLVPVIASQILCWPALVNGLLPCGSKASPIKPILTHPSYHKEIFNSWIIQIKATWEEIHKMSVTISENFTFEISVTPPRGQWVNLKGVSLYGGKASVFSIGPWCLILDK